MDSLLKNQGLWEIVKDGVFGVPQECLFCGGRGGEWGVCEVCRNALKEKRTNICKICGENWPYGLCPYCKKSLHHFDMQRSLGPYRGTLGIAINKMKYRGERWISVSLGRLLAQSLEELMPADLLVPVPASRKSLGKRGYNQALDLAKEVSLNLNLPFVDILRKEDRHEQKTLGQSTRWENLVGSISVTGNLDLQGKRIILIDDVQTTGATLDEAARVLKIEGAKRVHCGVLAKTEKG